MNSSNYKASNLDTSNGKIANLDTSNLDASKCKILNLDGSDYKPSNFYVSIPKIESILCCFFKISFYKKIIHINIY